ncbi:MAG: PQQ-binding-like beta-propeller repeat protein [Verrucomicrobiales bacterium]
MVIERRADLRHELRMMKSMGWILGAGMLISGELFAADWPSWRGEAMNGVAEGEAPPTSLEGDHQLWKVKLPGRGCSTPVVFGDRIFVTAPIAENNGVIAYSRRGEELWRAELESGVPGRGRRVGSSANSSPVTDGKRVFAFFKSGQLVAFDLEGEKLWDFNVFEKYGEDKLWWDVGTSPVITSRGLLLAIMQTEGNSNLLCFDKDTGEEIWKTPRSFDVAAESGDAYTTPLVVDLEGEETVVTWGADHLTGHRASDGELLWTCGGFNPKKNKNWRVIASPVIADGVAVVPYDRGNSLAGVKLGGRGDVTDERTLWRVSKLGTDSATPVAKGGMVFVLTDSGRDRGVVTCLEAKSGELLWKSSLPRGAQTYYASPLLAGETLYCIREDGVVFASPVTKSGLGDPVITELGESVIASPVVVDGMLLVRGADHLMAFKKP